MKTNKMLGKGNNSVRKQAWTLPFHRLQGRNRRQKGKKTIKCHSVHFWKHGRKEISREQRQEKKLTRPGKLLRRFSLS